jgi:type II secretory pathway component GspD/PulD (secretin)
VHDQRHTARSAARSTIAACSLLAAVAGAARAQQLQPEDRREPARVTTGRSPANTQPENQPEVQPGVQPGLQPGAEPATPEGELPAGDQPEDKGDRVSFDAFSEPVELSALVNYIGSTLGINIIVKGSLEGTVTFNAPVDVPKSRLLDLLDAILEQYDFAITRDPSGIYTVQPAGETPVTFGSDRATSKIIDTGGLRPTGLTEAINTILGKSETPQNNQPADDNIAYIDELGVIVMTGTPRDISRVEEIIADLQDRAADSRFSRIELEHIAAPVARDRVIQLVGGGTGSTSTNARNVQNINRGNPGQQPQAPTTGSTGGALDNVADRLTIDAQSNALIFRGNEFELQKVLEVVSVIDVPNLLERRSYYAGSAVQQIADLARQRGLGEVTILEDTTQNQNPFGGAVFFGGQQQNQNQQTQTEPITGGPTMVVDLRRQTIIYYGTETQQEELADLISLLDVGEDIVTLEYYKLSNARAEDVAEIIQGLITGRTQTGDSALLPNNQGFNQFQQFQQQLNRAAEGAEAGFAPDPNRVFVIADESNNQVIVKAPKKQQDEFAKLVGRLDLRRPQVYLEAMIVAVTDTKDFRLAVETQLAAGQFQAQNIFGLSDPGTTFQDPREVATGLPGFTSALIRSDMVPFIVTAVQTNTDSRILSAPQLLVNDNEEATIASIEQQPTTTTNQGNATTEVSFQDYQDAGTTLTVTPTISEAGYIRLEYDVELSNFIGSGSNGIPPPRQQRNVTGIATIPSDATIVVGGIEVTNTGSTIVKVPLLGDIPLLGNLFRDTNKNKSKTLLYIFITPKIMTDPTFQDLRLLTRGPQSEADVDPSLPPLRPNRIELVAPRDPAPPPEPPADRQTPYSEERD